MNAIPISSTVIKGFSIPTESRYINLQIIQAFVNETSFLFRKHDLSLQVSTPLATLREKIGDLSLLQAKLNQAQKNNFKNRRIFLIAASLGIAFLISALILPLCFSQGTLSSRVIKGLSLTLPVGGMAGFALLATLSAIFFSKAHQTKLLPKAISHTWAEIGALREELNDRIKLLPLS